MKKLLLSLLLIVAVHAGDTNSPASLRNGETWHSASRLERIAKDYAKQQKIEFSFEKTHRTVSLEKRGTNTVALIFFYSGFGKPVWDVEIAPSGEVLTNYLGIAICGTGHEP